MIAERQMAQIRTHYLIRGLLGIYQWKLSLIIPTCRTDFGLFKTQNVILKGSHRLIHLKDLLLAYNLPVLL